MKEKFDRNDVGKYAAILIVVIGSIAALLSTKNSSNQERLFQEVEGKGLVKGEVTQLVINHIGGVYTIKYKYVIDSVEYTDSRSDFCWSPSESDTEYFEGKFFPVLYEQDDPRHNRMLIGRFEFENFNLPFPPELKHVSDKFFNCKK